MRQSRVVFVLLGHHQGEARSFTQLSPTIILFPPYFFFQSLGSGTSSQIRDPRAEEVSRLRSFSPHYLFGVGVASYFFSCP